MLLAQADALLAQHHTTVEWMRWQRERWAQGRTGVHVVNDGERLALVMAVEPRCNLIDALLAPDLERRAPAFARFHRRCNEAQPTFAEDLAHLLAVKHFAPGRPDDVAQASFHPVVNELEHLSSARVEDPAVDGGRVIVSAVDSKDDIETTKWRVQANHVVDVEEEKGGIPTHSFTRFQLAAAMQAARKAWASASA